MKPLYIGRFAPSPSGDLHAGSLIAAMASYLDARVHGGKWLIRIEDIDESRTVPETSRKIIHTLKHFGLQSDDKILYQSERKHLYEAALQRLSPYSYLCSCSRREIADSALRTGVDGATIYPGTCRNKISDGRPGRALRLRTPHSDSTYDVVTFEDRWQGLVTQHLAKDVGDFVLKRADGFYAYQLAVVVDDCEQGVTHVVRGADLLHSTPRQIYLQTLLSYPTPAYLHIPVAQDRNGEKLSKHSGSMSIANENPMTLLALSANFLGLSMTETSTIDEFWRVAQRKWEELLHRRKDTSDKATAKTWKENLA